MNKKIYLSSEFINDIWTCLIFMVLYMLIYNIINDEKFRSDRLKGDW